MIAEDVRDLHEHRRRLADPNLYRPVPCPTCGHDRMHVHCRPERHPRGEPSLPAALAVLQFRCAGGACRATWRILPLFLARHLWHAWRAVARIVRPTEATRGSRLPAIARRTRDRWRARLAVSAQVLVAVISAGAGVVVRELLERIGQLGTRAELVEAYVAMSAPPPREQLSMLAALVHRLEPGLRLM